MSQGKLSAPSVPLSPTREAQLRLAFDDAWDARGTNALRDRVAILHDVSRRLYAEQKAARGLLPNSLDDSIAILRVAARVIEVYGPALAGDIIDFDQAILRQPRDGDAVP